MSKEIESASAALFDKIRSRFSPINLGDEKANATSSPEKARFFNFVYTDSDGIDHGNITMSLIGEESLKIYFSHNVTDNMSAEQRTEWFTFLRNLRKFAKRNLLKFDTRDINKSNLDLRDIKQQTSSDDTFTSDEVIAESKLRGTPGRPYHSIAEAGKTKILVKHSDRINDEVRGARTRKIESIFLETELGERFLLPHNNLHGAYALAEHLNQGGTVHDDFAGHINGMVNEMNAMRHFVRGTRLREFEDAETTAMTEAAFQHYADLKETLKKLKSSRYFSEYKECYVPVRPIEEEIDVNTLKERWVKKVYDDRFDEALPYVYRAYAQQNESANRFSSELDEWADSVLAETVATDAELVARLNDFMSQPQPGGIDGIDVVAELSSILPNKDSLISVVQNYCGPEGQGPDADTRAIVKKWLEYRMPEVYNELDFDQTNGQVDFAGEVSPNQQPSHEYGATGMDEPVVNENDLNLLRSLAGIK